MQTRVSYIEEFKKDSYHTYGYEQEEFGICPYITFYIYHKDDEVEEIANNIIDILEKNYKTFLSTANAAANGDDAMMVDDKSSMTDIVKAKIEQVLTETGFSDKRAAKLDQTDFLKLLYAFHQVGLHFA